ncbi:MAG: hypothetical protein KF767_07335 [Bdellovibrionaceae bacterium]|nr:hypothetical protein [Pseudobdellovibrionaceae bacterium]
MQLMMLKKEETGTLSLVVLTLLVAIMMGIEAKSSPAPAAVQVIQAASQIQK